jgi:hypothetical protein
MENNLNDPKNIAGISGLLKDDDIDSHIDLEELEREIALSGHIDVEEINIADNYRKEINRISRNYDIGVDDCDDNNFKTSNNSVYDVHTSNESTDENKYSENKYSENKYSENNYNENNYDENLSVEPINNIPRYDSYSSPKHASYSNNTYESNDKHMINMTIEERKQDKINNVLKNIDDGDLEFNVNAEREEDDRASLLEQIDMLKITLDDDGVDISGVPSINKQSNMNDIQNVYKILRLKNDRNRYCSFAEELILAGSYGMEYMFDGKKEWFGKTPDLTDWSSTVKVKLRRMRYETSTFVGQVMQEYNLSSGMRLALELLPSMFLYSRNRRISKNDNLVSDNEYKNAISQLNSI